MLYRGNSFWRSGQLVPHLLREALILDETEMASRAALYSKPVDMPEAIHSKIIANFDIGGSASITFRAQVWNGADWVANFGANGSTQWIKTFMISGTQTKAYLIGDLTGRLQCPAMGAWRFFRIRVDIGTGAGGASSFVKIYAATK